MNKVLQKLIDKSDIVSFDIFDTLIKRNCISPTDIFKYVEIEYNYNTKNQISNFFDYRIEAERVARQNSINNEVTLDEIYKNIKGYSSNVCNKLKEIEIETEKKFCQKNEKMFEVYKYCMKKGKKIICISDMYLKKEIIKEILLDNDYNIDTIYVSCEYKCSKYGGQLFDLVLEDLKVKPDKIIHIGDAKRADCLSPLKRKIKTYYIKKNVKRSKYIKFKEEYKKELANNLVYSLINNNSYRIDNYYEKIGYEIMGPLCCSFVYWVNNISGKLNVDKLLFCARDMEMIQKIYNMIISENKKISNSYFYISRKSSFLPFLYINNEYNNFLHLLPEGKRKVSIEELLLSLNIKISDLDKKLKKYELSYIEKYDLNELKKNKKFKEFYNDEVVNFISSVGKEQYNYFMNYLKSLSVSNSTAIVDLGWHGTTQKIMTKISNYNFIGLYFGLYGRDNYVVTSKNSFAYIFDEKTKKYSKKIFSFLPLFEILFSALHGSTSHYIENKDSLYVLEEPKNNNNEHILSIQTGAIKFASDFSKYSNYFNEIKLDIYINELIRIGVCPNLRESKNLGNIYTENLETRKFANPDKLVMYIFKLRKLKQDFTNSEWKIGFMKQLFKIKFPYYTLYNCFKKLRDKE